MVLSGSHQQRTDTGLLLRRIDRKQAKVRTFTSKLDVNASPEYSVNLSK